MLVFITFGAFNDKNDNRLYEDLHNWIRGEDKTILPLAGVSPFHNYWDCMQSDMPNNKLPVIFITIFSIAVNKATCERYFSELALFHTATRNRMSLEKARKLALVHKRVRGSEVSGVKSMFSQLQRLSYSKKRTRLRDRDNRFECNQNEEEEEGIFVGSDGAFEYWRMVICFNATGGTSSPSSSQRARQELEGGDDIPVALNSNIDLPAMQPSSLLL